ncbi:hypothetical protein DESPIG_02183 [Desulfovibrio piger ATCC 29098]|uniref:Uncharacterized protein n=1 Tax=Desulfovibrio piger ATCC 29098 TaxID=411464 RepID=B6WVR5_9BACT|nr:hypothetical protein DESPIG_02183 [Desulfovibrio piger ATCC 29098]
MAPCRALAAGAEGPFASRRSSLRARRRKAFGISCPTTQSPVDTGLFQ